MALFLDYPQLRCSANQAQKSVWACVCVYIRETDTEKENEIVISGIQPEQISTSEPLIH